MSWWTEKVGGKHVDGQRFDKLTKTLTGATPSRRGVLRGLAGGALAAVFGGRALDASAQFTDADDAVCEGQQVICNAAGVPGFTCAEGCVCARNVSGTKQCVNGLGDTCRNRKRCNRNKDCGSGRVCIRVSGCRGEACTSGRAKGRCFNRCAVT